MKYRAALFSSAFCLVFVSVFFVGRSVWADDYGLNATAGEAGLIKETSVPNIIGNVIGAGLSLVTVLFFILMIYAGLKWMLARGDEGKAKEALDTIIAAIIGIVVVLAAYAITNFVFKSVGEGGAGSASGGSSANAICMITDGNTYSCKKKSAVSKADDCINEYTAQKECQDAVDILLAKPPGGGAAPAVPAAKACHLDENFPGPVQVTEANCNINGSEQQCIGYSKKLGGGCVWK